MAEPFVCPADCDAEGQLHLDMQRKQVSAILKARFGGKRVELEVRERKSKRSDRQNRAFHAAITPWAHELGYAVEELKRDLLGLCWGYYEQKSKSKLTGEEHLVPLKPHTSKLNTKEFSDLMEFTVMKAAETGYVMPLPDEFKEQKASRERSQ
jgi:hypothetical protein